MLNRNQPSRYESSTLAAALAVAGTLFLSDKLSSLGQHGVLTFPVVSQVAGILLLAAGLCLLLVEWPA